MTVQPEQARPLGHDLGMGAIATEDDANLWELWLALCRRRKLVAVTAIAVLTFTVVVAVCQRIFKSVYLGSFSLLITDPISSDNYSSNSNTAALSRAC
jgi:succinoglycan biosynthesis transport protein ExoP